MPVDTTIILRRDTALNLWAPTALADAVGVLKNDGAGNLSWGTGGGGITGPVSSTITALVRWDDALGTAVRDSNVTLADSGTTLAFSGAGGVSAGGSNQNVTLTPSGTGKSVLAGPVQLSALTAGFVQSDASGNLSIGTPGSTSPAGSNTQIQYNNSGAFGASSALTWDNTNSTIRVGVNGLTPRDPTVTRAFFGGAANDVTLEWSSNFAFADSGLADWGFTNRGVTSGGSRVALWQVLTGVSDANTGQIAIGVKKSAGDSDVTTVVNIFNTGLLKFSAYGVGYLKTDASGNVTAGSLPSSGDFSGPSSATDNAIVRFDGTTGKLGQNSGVTIDDNGELTALVLHSLVGASQYAAFDYRTPSQNYSWVLGGASTPAPNRFYLYDQTAGAERWSMDTSGQCTFLGGAGGYVVPVTVRSNSSNCNLLILDNLHSSGSMGNQIILTRAGSNKWGLGNDSTQSGAQDFFILDHVAGAYRLVIDASGNFSFPGITLTTGLSIAVATKSFPLTINGTTVNVLCQ